MHNNYRGRFCGTCGYDLEKEEPKERNFLSTVMICIAVFCAIILIVELACLIVNAYDVMEFVKPYSVPVFLLIPDVYVLFELTGTALSIYWILIVFAIIASAAYAIYRFTRSLTKTGTEKPEETGMFWVSGMFALSLAITWLIITMVSVLELESVGSPFPDVPLANMFDFANAAVWEEIIIRVLLIGVPLAIISLFINQKASALKSLLGGSGMSATAIILIIISSVIFGLAHFDGWDQYWKILDTLIGGLLMGYVFVRFGLYASILVHFLTNYMSAFGWFGYGVVGDVAFYVIVVMGIVALSYLFYRTDSVIEKTNALPKFFDANAQKRKP